jgi:hypothetical protein
MMNVKYLQTGSRRERCIYIYRYRRKGEEKER